MILTTCARLAGNIRAYLEKQGTPIGVYDVLIGSHALALDVTVVTNNIREFERIPGLRLENWAENTRAIRTERSKGHET